MEWVMDVPGCLQDPVTHTHKQPLNIISKRLITGVLICCDDGWQSFRSFEGLMAAVMNQKECLVNHYIPSRFLDWQDGETRLIVEQVQ